MLRHFILAATLLFSSAVFAQEATSVDGFDKLTPNQQEEILKVVQQKAKENGFQGTTEKSTAVEETKGVLAYVAESGEAIGKGIGAIAREIGVVVTEFLNSPVGMLAVGLLVWQVIGGDIVQLFLGSLILLAGNIFLLPAIYRWMADEVASVPYTATTWFGLGKPEERKRIVHRVQDSERLGSFICICGVVNFAGFIALITL